MRAVRCGACCAVRYVLCLARCVLRGACCAVRVVRCVLDGVCCAVRVERCVLDDACYALKFTIKLQATNEHVQIGLERRLANRAH